MDDSERSLINFVVQWCEYGGGEELILPQFGIVPTEFYHRILAVVERGENSGLSSSTRLFLRQHCKVRLATSDHSPYLNSRSPCLDRKPAETLQVSH